MYKSYLAAAQSNNVLERTDMAFLMEFFGSLMGPGAFDPADANDQCHQLLNLVGGYHTALSQRGSTFKVKGDDSIDSHDLNDYEYKVLRYILIDAAYRIYRGQNTLILKIMAEWMENNSHYTESADWDNFFISLFSAKEIAFLARHTLASNIREALTGKALFEGAVVDACFLTFNRELNDTIDNFMLQVDTLDFDIEGQNEYTALCLLKYRINQLLFNQ